MVWRKYAEAAYSHTESAASASAAPTAPTAAPKSNEGVSGDTPPGAETSEIKAFRCDCLMNARYHSTREAFLDTVHRWLMFGVIALGAAWIVDLAGSVLWTRAAGGAAVAILGALDLVFDLSNRARSHALMKRRYFELLAEVVSKKVPLVEAEACMTRFAADEEPAYHALIAASWNAAQEMVYGDEAKSYKIKGCHLFLKNFLRFEGTKFDLIK